MRVLLVILLLLAEVLVCLVLLMVRIHDHRYRPVSALLSGVAGHGRCRQALQRQPVQQQQ